MALVRAERVLQTSTTNGTGSLTLGDPVTGYRSFASVMSNGDTCYYSIVKVSDSGRPLGDWEVGLGTLTNATTFARTTVLQSSNGGNAVDFTDGLKYLFLTLTSTEIIDILVGLASKAEATKVDVYSASDTWSKPAGAIYHDIFCIGGGKGGGSGALTINTTASAIDPAGGSGGQPGALGVLFGVPSGALGSTVTVTVGAGGAGGASRTTTGTTNAGANGGNSSFGSHLTANGATANTSNGSGGAILDGALSTNATANLAGYVFGYSGTISNSQVIASGTSAINAAPNGGTAGTSVLANAAAATGTNGESGLVLTGRAACQISNGGGGGGAAMVTNAGAATAAIGGDGGAGGFPGGGGGGGGAAGAQRSTAPTGTKSGKGGDGGSGAVIVISHF